MKKLIVYVSFLFLTINKSSAQIFKSVGFQAGWSGNFISLHEKYDSRDIGGSVHQLNTIAPELQFEVLQMNNLSFLLSASYIQKGFTHYSRTYSGFFIRTVDEKTIDENADYLTLFFAPKVTYQRKRLAVYGFAGPYLARLVNHSEFYNRTIYVNSNYGRIEENVSVLKPTMWGATLGTGLEFKRKDELVYYSFEIQYMADFGKAADYSKGVDHFDDTKKYTFEMFNKTLLISLGMHIPLTKTK